MLVQYRFTLHVTSFDFAQYAQCQISLFIWSWGCKKALFVSVMFRCSLILQFYRWLYSEFAPVLGKLLHISNILYLNARLLLKSSLCVVFVLFCSLYCIVSSVYPQISTWCTLEHSYKLSRIWRKLLQFVLLSQPRHFLHKSCKFMSL